MGILTRSPRKCCHPIPRLDVDLSLQGQRSSTGEDSNHHQNQRYRQLVLIFRGVCASMHGLRSRFITDAESVQSIGRGPFMTQSQAWPA